MDSEQKNSSNNSLFAATLHPVTSKYIQQKYKTTNADLDNVDLRQMCDDVKLELQEIEKSAAYDYLKVEKEMIDLDKEITVSDDILQELEDVLLNFRDHLNGIKSEMTSLQERSLKMNTSLTNRKNLSKLLGTFMDSAVLDPKLIDSINEAPIDDDYVQHIKILCQKLEYLKNSQLSDATAVKELEPELNKLKNKACGRVRTFLLEKLNMLKQPMTNVYYVQKNYLIKYRILTEFLKEHYREIYTELCKNYAEILSKFYLNSFKTYSREVEKLVGELYGKKDILFNEDPNYMKSAIVVKNLSFQLQGKSIFNLSQRDNILKKDYEDQVQLNISSVKKNQKYLVEQIFQSINLRLINCIQGEILFSSEFFNINPEQNEMIFGGIFKQTFNYLYDFFKGMASNSYDPIGMLLIILVTDLNRKRYNDKQFQVLQYYFDHIGIIIWPRFEQIFESHLKSILQVNIKIFKENEKKLGWQFMYERYIDFAISLYTLYSNFEDNSMLSIRLSQLRLGMLNLINMSSKEIEKKFDRITYLLKVYDTIKSSFDNVQLYQSKKQFTDDITEIEKESNKYIDELIQIYMQDMFINLLDFVKNYCKQEQSEGQQQQQPQLASDKLVDNIKLVENICSDLQFSLFKRTEAFKLECSKLFQGFQIQKLILKRFSHLFITYYGSFYKYLKNNYPTHANKLTKVHEIMKDLQKSFNI